MSKLLSVLTGLTLLATTAIASASSLPDVLKGSLKLYTDNQGICSTTLVADDLLLTAAHCVEEKNLNVRIQTVDKDFNLLREEVVYVKPVRVLKNMDVAILAPVDKLNDFTDVFGPYVQVVDVATQQEVDENLVPGTTMWAVGYPKALDLTITDGLFSTRVAPIPGYWETPLYRFSAPITGGNSGGGFIIKVGNEYKLAGVNVGAFRDVEFMNFATPIESVQAVLNGFMTAKTIQLIEDSPVNPGASLDSK